MKKTITELQESIQHLTTLNSKPSLAQNNDELVIALLKRLVVLLYLEHTEEMGDTHV